MGNVTGAMTDAMWSAGFKDGEEEPVRKIEEATVLANLSIFGDPGPCGGSVQIYRQCMIGACRRNNAAVRAWKGR